MKLKDFDINEVNLKSELKNSEGDIIMLISLYLTKDELKNTDLKDDCEGLIFAKNFNKDKFCLYYQDGRPKDINDYPLKIVVREKDDFEKQFKSDLRQEVQWLSIHIDEYIKNVYKDKDIPKDLENALYTAIRLKTLLMENNFNIKILSDKYTHPIYDNNKRTEFFDKNNVVYKTIDDLCEE